VEEEGVCEEDEEEEGMVWVDGPALRTSRVVVVGRRSLFGSEKVSVWLDGGATL